MSNEANGPKRQKGLCRIAVIVLLVIALALLVALAIVSVKLSTSKDVKMCSSGQGRINPDPPTILPPFHDLTSKEITAVKTFLYQRTDLNLVRPGAIATNASYIFTMEILIPNKSDVINFFDKGMGQPERKAMVVVFRGDKLVPCIEEYVVGPLPNPSYCNHHVTLPFNYRPYTAPELQASIARLTDTVHENVGHILKESYGGALKDCMNDCLRFQMANPVAPVNNGEQKSRKFWHWLSRDIEFHSLHILDFAVLMNLNDSNAEKFTIDKITYANKIFDSLEDLRDAYQQGTIAKTKVNFPKNDRQLFSSMNRREHHFPSDRAPPPEEFEPGGYRYSINGRHISYMDWDFDVRMSTVSGPQLWNIKFLGRRIVYELSLQEVAVMYSAHNPGLRFTDFSDSVMLLGARARGLVPGYDCPKHSTFLSSTHSFENYEEAVKIPTSFCVFEHSTGMPLRRHLAFEATERQFYEGMVDTVLTLRTISTIGNYDYIFDFIFHQNGAMEVKAVSTGYLLTSFQFPQEDMYGFQLKDRLTANIHHHLFHFKVDMDINGRKNNFETLDVKPTVVDNSMWSIDQQATYAQTRLVRTEIKTEKEAAIKYNFDSPKYLTFYNKEHKSQFGVPRAYRLFVKGMSKQLFPRNKGQETAFSWARYQVAVTKYKDSEKKSSSVYAVWDAMDPVVNFQSFIDDDDVISDEDQVAWVTMGMHHIPHMEDLPVTSTVGLALEFFLLPYNYFDEDPAMGSIDAIRIEPKDQAHMDEGVRVERYGKFENDYCKPKGTSYDDKIKRYPKTLFNY